jgi:NAD(P)-dependent dehydrogenase (short-subunit alcohol dehydrogenase family)
MREPTGKVALDIGEGVLPVAGRTSYAASKTALIGLTRSLAPEAGPHGIRMNPVSPGLVMF